MYEIRRYLSCAFVRTQAGVTSRVKGRFETRACTYVCTIYTPSSYISNEIKLTGTMREIILSLYIYICIYICKCYVSAFQIEALRDARKNFVISIYFAHHWHPPSPGKFTYVLTWILSPLNSAAGSACLRGRNRKRGGEVELGEKTWTSLYASIRRGTAEEEKGVYRVDQLIRAL